MDREILITGARVYTAKLSEPWAEAILVRGNRIAFVGNQTEARSHAVSYEEIRVPGGLAVPGLNDSHIHLSHAAQTLSMLNLEGVTALEELQSRLRDYAAANPDREWIEACNVFYQPLMHLDGPHRLAIDEAVADRPVFLRGFDFHTAWCNTEALRRAGIERGASVPRPNEVVVDPENGLAMGLLKERGAFDLVGSLIPGPSVEEGDAALVEAMHRANREGITSVQNMDADLDRLEQYERLQQRSALSVRASHYMTIRKRAPLDGVAAFAELTARFHGAWNRVAGIKLFIDGVIESKTALMFEPYTDGSGESGEPDIDLDLYRQIVDKAHGLGLDVATHAIGDRGVCFALDAYEAVHDRGTQQRRHRIEHIETIRPGDIPRFRKLGVTASMQPLHAAPTTDPRFSPWVSLAGPDREPFAFAWRSILESGARLCYGSDWPVVTPSVRAGLRAALTRSTMTGEPPGGWHPQQCVTLGQALDAYTRTAAYAEQQESQKGTLGAGMLADVTVFSRDLFDTAPAFFPDVAIALTMVDGQIVHRAV